MQCIYLIRLDSTACGVVRWYPLHGDAGVCGFVDDHMGGGTEMLGGEFDLSG